MWPIKNSDKLAFGRWITGEDWSNVTLAESTVPMTQVFYETIRAVMDRFFLTKTVFVHVKDKPWMNSELKAFFTRRQKVFAEGKTCC